MKGLSLRKRGASSNDGTLTSTHDGDGHGTQAGFCIALLFSYSKSMQHIVVFILLY